jgi:hypothetical protein
MLANFYYEASPIAVILGVAVALGLVIALGFTKRIALSAAGSAVGCGVIAFCVWACGHGDIVGLFYLVIGVPLAATAGGLAGLVSASIIRGKNEARDDKHHGSKDDSADAS